MKKTIITYTKQGKVIKHIDTNTLNAVEAAEFLQVPLSSLYRFTHLRLIRYSRPTGKKIFFKIEDLEEFMTRNTKEVQTNPSYEQ